MPYHETWRNIRKIMHQFLTPKQCEAYRPVQDAESKQLLWDYLHHPDRFYVHNGRYANSVIMTIVFGKRTRADDPSVTQLYKAIDDFFINTVPGQWLVDSSPQLARLPKWGQWWRPFGEDVYSRTIDVYCKFFDEFEKSVADGTSNDCFATRFNSVVEKYNFDRDQEMFVAGSLVDAASDTTRNANNLLIAAGNRYVLGLSYWSDWDRLPVIQTVIKEIMRWRPNNLETGFPHAFSEDSEFEGYLFEKGTVEYEDPLAFKPERLDNEHLWNALQGNWGFGAGRRVSVGWDVAVRNMLIVFARVLYCFNFEEDPNEPIDTMRIPMTTGGKPPFKPMLKPRSAAHAELIRRECNGVADELAALERGTNKKGYL